MHRGSRPVLPRALVHWGLEIVDILVHRGEQRLVRWPWVVKDPPRLFYLLPVRAAPVRAVANATAAHLLDRWLVSVG